MAVFSDQAFRVLFDIAPDATFVVDGAGRILLANAQAATLFRRPVASLVGTPVDSLLPERFRAAHAARREAYASWAHVRPMGGGPQLAALRGDGVEIPVEVALGPLTLGLERYYVASVRDVSDLARTRQAAQRGRYNLFVARFGLTALRQPDFAALLDEAAPLMAEAMRADAAISFLLAPGGAGARKVSAAGIDAAALGRLRLEQHAGGQAGPAPAIVEDLATGGRCALDEALRGLGMRAALCVPLSGDGEAPGALVAASREPGRWGEDDAHFLQAVANTLSAARQRAATEERLLHAQRLEALGQLIGGVAHDFNNLLMVIGGSLQMLEDAAPGDRSAAELSRQAMAAAERGAALTRKLLAFARKQPLNPAPMDLNQVVRDFRDLLMRTLGEQVAVRLDLHPGLPVLVADAAQVETALLNLALNARDAMPEGGAITLQTGLAFVGEAGEAAAPELGPGAYARVAVRDTGAGMDPAVLARAIEPFFTTKGPGKGSGLGLSMVYGFARQSGGTATLLSSPGEGTTAAIYLPLPADSAAIAPRAGAAALPAGSETVLVVEDEARVLDIAAAFLGRLGYRVLAAPDGETALARLREHPEIELLFTDLALPDTDGVALAGAVRALRPGLPVLYTSGYLSSGALERMPPEERAAVLAKPYRREDLAFRVRTALARRDPRE